LAYYNENSQVTVNLGRESLIRVFNSSSTPYQNGVPVYLSASTNTYPNAWLARADRGVSSDVSGVTTTYISASGYGYVSRLGRVNGISLNYPIGTTLWLSATQSGSYQATQPTGSYEGVQIGTVVASGSNTSILATDITRHVFTSTTAFTASYVTGSKVSRGGTMYNSAGITSGANIIIWEAPVACTVTNVKGYRVGGSGATINARKNGASNHLASDLSVSSADTWTDGGAVQNVAYAAGDKMEIMITGVTGGPTQVAIQVNLIK
jgi:hypothetical protein